MHISVIIPTLNETEHIEKCISTLRDRAQMLVQIIVVDAGSEDNTVQLASGMDVVVLDRPELRGRKYASLNEGVRHADGDTLMFLDADTLVPQGYDQLVNASLEFGAVGGGFAMHFDSYTPSLRIIRAINHIRYRLTHRFFGDQAVFCTREAFERSGGYPPSLIMESAHFCTRLKKLGRLKLISNPVITSSRRFMDGGVWKVFWMDTQIFVRDLAGLSTEYFAKKYWRENERE